MCLQSCGNFGTLLWPLALSPTLAASCERSVGGVEGGGGRGICPCLMLITHYDYLLPASCPLMWLPVSPRAENSDGCSFTSISLRRLFNLFVCMNRKNVHDIASSAISSTELQSKNREREREGELLKHCWSKVARACQLKNFIYLAVKLL